MSKRFDFKQFGVDIGQCGMPVSTDGVLLGAWSTAKTSNRILDIGTGTGLLALMLAQRFQSAAITAIELDSTAFETASRNFTASPWPQRIKALHQDVTSWHSPDLFDHIVCNPPYFTSGEQASSTKRANARHTETLSHLALIKALSSLITPEGEANLILPTPEGEIFCNIAHENGLNLVRRTEVRTLADKPPTRLLLSFSPGTQNNLEEATLTINCNGGHSDAFTSLTRDFYLKL